MRQLIETTTRLQQCKNFIAIQKVYALKAAKSNMPNLENYKRELLQQVTQQFISLVDDEYTIAIHDEILKFREYLLD